MPRTQARIGYGSQVYIGDGATPTETFTKIAEVRQLDPPDVELNVVDASNMESPDVFMEEIAGMLAAGEATLSMAFLPADPTQDLLRQAQLARRLANFRIVYPSGTKRFEFAAHVRRIGRPMPLDDKMVMNVSLKASGKADIVTHP